jgi:hypothetical protein
MNLDVEAFCAPNPDPWQPPPRLGYPQHSDAEFLRGQIKGFEELGWLDPKSYDRIGREPAEALASLVDELSARAGAVVIVLMPEHTAFRRRVPDLAVEMLVSALERQGGGSHSVADFRAAIPDAEFTDYCHLNDTGRAHFTAQLARWLREWEQPESRGARQ